MRIIILFVALMVAFGYSQPTIKRDWTRVNNETSVAGDTYIIPPRAASFSDGRYIIVYTIKTANSDSIVVGQIFNADGSIAKAEFMLDSNLSPFGIFSAPNVVVFNDDTFLVVYRWENQPSLYARRFNSDGTPARSSFSADDPSYPVNSPFEDGMELIGFADKSWAILYFSPFGSRIVLAAFNSDDRYTWTAEPYVTEMSVATAIIGDRARTTSYMVIESVSSDLNFAQATPSYNSFVTSSVTPDDVLHPSEPTIALTGDILTSLFTIGDSVSFAIASSLGLGILDNGPLFVGNSSAPYSSPAIIGLNDTSAFIAYRWNSAQLVYRTATHSISNDVRAFTPTPIQYSITNNLKDVRFVPMLDGDLLVVAKDSVGGDIYHQVLTFCGNNQLELNEQCDGGPNCKANCRCSNSLIPFQGVCGLPNVEPVLDCVEPSGNSYKLHFSFNNQDGVQQTIQHGIQNLFTPSNVATDRPQTFAVGSSLTYPLSPYVATVPTTVLSTVTQINWLLGSYNLTIDLTNITALLCPASVGFTADVKSASYLDYGDIFANNFATRYNISVSRLTPEVVQTGGSLPVKKRGYNDYRFDVTLYIAPANDTATTTEPTPTQAVQTAIEDYKRNSTEVEQDLLQGYDPDTSIKEITPTPTGVEVRGNRYDSSSSAPISSPVANNPTSQPTAVTPIAVSSSNSIVPSSLTLAIFAMIF